MTLAGFPHSGTSGSTPTCGSPKLFAAYHALHRLSVPRHPPCALIPLDRICLFTRPTEPFLTHTWCSPPRIPPRRIPPQLPFPLPKLSINQSPGCAFPMSARPVRTFRARAAPRSLACAYWSLQKGGDPAAGSPTATLLRLRPSHRARLRRLPPRRVGSPTSGAPDFHGVTGGVYKARERIHRGVADPRLLAIPTSCSRVTDCNPNLDRVFAIRSPSRACSALSRPL
jgi:hypothetical protein